MTIPAPLDRLISVEEYLRLEEIADLRHEFVAGERFAMTGGTVRHSTITLNIASHLRARARGGACRVFVTDLKVRAASDVFYYPDVVVQCTPAADTDVYVHEPCLIIEVTSRSTAATDRREKLVAYRQIETLRAYLVVHHGRRRVDVHSRGVGTDAWTHVIIAGDGVVPIPSPEGTLPLDLIYEGVSLPAVWEPEPDEYASEESLD
jgi:Uma2 family endonuclease